MVQDSGRLKTAIRIILTCGYADKIPLSAEPNLIIVTEDLPDYPEEIYKNGVKIISINYQREFPKIKSLNYLNEFLIEPLKKEKNAFDVLYHSGHGITECPRSNFFVFKDGTLITPSENILHGITRRIVLQLAKDYFKIEERAISLSEIKDIDEAFITSTTKGIVPVSQIDDIKIGSGTPGVQTKRIMKLFHNYTNEY